MFNPSFLIDLASIASFIEITIARPCKWPLWTIQSVSPAS